jgi:hypothetical protein
MMPNFEITPTRPATHAVWHALNERGPQTLAELRELFGGDKRVASAVNNLSAYHKVSKHALKSGKCVWQAVGNAPTNTQRSTFGQALFSGPKARPRAPRKPRTKNTKTPFAMALPRTHAYPKEIYTGTELDRNPGIPAARYKAFDLPSRIGNRLHYPNGRVTNLDGQLIAEKPGSNT